MLHTTRRDALKTLGLLSSGLFVGSRAAWSADRSPNEKLNLGIIGPGGRGAGNLDGVASENIVAICDADDRSAKSAYEQYPSATKYKDFRKLIENEKLDGIVVSTTDHTHAHASIYGMRRGLHCYCEKPLTHSVWEARLVAKTAAEAKVATQMGTQIHAEDNYRRVVEIIQAGVIGPVERVHVWVGALWGGGERPSQAEAVPPEVDWDLWLGPAPERPYHSTYLPANWRRWWDFGNGTLGDMGCHYMDLVFWSLGLRHPKTIAAEGAPPHPETGPLGLKVTWEFPERGDQPPVTVSWTDGNAVENVFDGNELPGAGVYFIGSKGTMFADYGRYRLFPRDKFQGFTPPPQTIPASIGHHAEWIEACKTGGPTTCNFDYSGALTEAVLLGTVAYRTGKKLEWDPVALKATNAPEADQFLRRNYRKGWEL
ncbi:MAG: Gfo/Idh/MocA family oxidoreductase [Planctomyces sp.]|nr:Gfo/Idh/MocA family oxidoreductase [Planctomyces sp.]